ncbi:restriction endonuclease [Kribbella sp. CA-294648]|uniref:restriction endonuclease n=1 Tax=Kribbella sp. CA-294648 TaxID=3239948 RepID=UPI003D8BF9A5
MDLGRGLRKRAGGFTRAARFACGMTWSGSVLDGKRLDASRSMSWLWSSPRNDHRHQLTAAAYQAAGYATQLTKQTRDGGRDVETTIVRDGMVQRVLIECEQWTGTVGVEQVRGLAGVVGDDRATSGILVTTGAFSPEAAAFAGRTPNCIWSTGTRSSPCSERRSGQDGVNASSGT